MNYARKLDELECESKSIFWTCESGDSHMPVNLSVLSSELVSSTKLYSDLAYLKSASYGLSLLSSFIFQVTF